MWPIIFDDLSDAQLMEQYRKVRQDFLDGSVLTGGNGGDGGFSRTPEQRADIANRMGALFEEIKRRKLTTLEMPARRTRVVFGF